MKQITLNIPDQQFDFFMQLIAKLGYEADNNDCEIPEAHKNIVRERIINSNDDNLIEWKQARKQLKFKA